MSLAVAGGPTQAILRPVQIEDRALWEALHVAAMFGDARVFDQGKGVEKGLDGAALLLAQGRDGGHIKLDEQGGMLIQTPIESSAPRGSVGTSGLPVLIEEDVASRITAALAYANLVLERIDPTQRLTHIAVAARLVGGDYLAWRTLAEHAASPQSVSLGSGQGRDGAPVHIGVQRAALRLDRTPLVEDLLVPLRRQWRQEPPSTSTGKGGVRFV